MPAACRISSTSLTSASPADPLGGQSRSGETQPCHVMCVVLPNDALFMHGTVAALLPRAAARSAKKRAAVAFGTVNAFSDPAELPSRFCSVAEALPSDETEILYPTAFVEPELTMTALSIEAPATQPAIASALSKVARTNTLKACNLGGRSPTRGSVVTLSRMAKVRNRAITVIS